ncbi:MAG: type I DNA topoisomerase [Proteobacteria bacterium]|nr:type I DNA topoisomerase [Pseudomonadota bacterium]
MDKSLVVVESPAKAKTIEKYLGSNCKVVATYGHIKDLPERTLGVDIEKGFHPTYVNLPKAKKVIADLKKYAKDVENIYIASDPDREGEAIAFHVAEELKDLKKNIKRVLFYEVTKEAIKRAFQNPTDLDENKYDAQKSRRVLDRLVGYKISPILWKKVKTGLSAGRVQSVALRIICEREREIKNFVPKEYWIIKGTFIDDKENILKAKLEEIDGKKCNLANKEATDQVVEEIKQSSFYLKNKIEKPRKKSAPTPFITSTLQQEGVRKLSFSTKKTMMLAQMLYEGIDLGDMGRQGLITYMRTDSPRISNEAIESVRAYIKQKYGDEYLSEKPRQFEGKKTAQEAHECIRPTSLELEPEKVKEYLTKDQYALYKMIFDRFVACQMKDAEYNQTIYEIVDREKEKFLFRVKGLTLKFPGFLAVYIESEEKGENSDEGEEKLPQVEENTSLVLKEILPEQNFTSPPPRFTEATIVKELEEDGIGRPSTYATIISTLIEKEYVKIIDGKFYPTELGCTVSDLLVQGFPDVINVDFTAKMEQQLDEVEEGKVKWNKIVEDFYKKFVLALDNAFKTMANLKKTGIATDVVCDVCGKPMVIKYKNGKEFLACSGYPDCKNIKNFEKDKEGKIVIIKQNEKSGKKCPECGADLIIKRGKYSNFLACERYPDCKYTESIKLEISCPLCNSPLIERKNKKGKTFYGCSAYPSCKFISNQKPYNEPCPECGNPYLVESIEKKVPIYKCPKRGCKFKKQR